MLTEHPRVSSLEPSSPSVRAGTVSLWAGIRQKCAILYHGRMPNIGDVARRDSRIVWPRLADGVIVQECESDAWFERPDGISDEQMAEILEPMKTLTESTYRRLARKNIRELMEILPPSEPVRTVLSD